MGKKLSGFTINYLNYLHRVWEECGRWGVALNLAGRQGHQGTQPPRVTQPRQPTSQAPSSTTGRFFLLSIGYSRSCRDPPFTLQQACA